MATGTREIQSCLFLCLKIISENFINKNYKNKDFAILNFGFAKES